ncbi:MAG: hypothetical protein IJ309_04520 [Clostridia bacterium]|nr:hypothetical protein [Clostridia bacterium]
MAKKRKNSNWISPKKQAELDKKQEESIRKRNVLILVAVLCAAIGMSLLFLAVALSM